MILKGNCIEVMKAMKPNSVDAIVTDPPYGLEFMGKEWDKLSDDVVSKSWNTKGRSMTAKPKRQPDSPGGRHATKTSPTPNPRCRKCGRVIHGTDTKKGFVVCHCKEPEIYMPNTYAVKMQFWHTQWLTEAYRVLKPGGSMLVMGGTRTFHRLACAIEDSGFIIKDTLMWLYGSGFPKAQDLGKMIKKKKTGKVGVVPRGWLGFKVGGIKPAYEPIIWAVKPPEGSYVDNVLKWGVGAVNVDETRIEAPEGLTKGGCTKYGGIFGNDSKVNNPEGNSKGRFPANVILDEEAGKLLDEQSGNHKSGKVQNIKEAYKGESNTGLLRGGSNFQNQHGDSGGASRFFYCAKASRGERNAGLEGMEEKDLHWSSGHKNPGSFQADGTKKKATNNHPTVKPIRLFEYLIKLVTREGQIILDPFIGSGTTAIAAHNVGRKCVGIEKEDEYLTIAKRRIDYWENQPKQNSLNLGG